MTAKHNATKKPLVEPDADAPLSDDEFQRGHGAIVARRAATGLTQQAFSDRYGIPVASLRDWEQGRRSPDSATLSYLRVIARLPEVIAKALSEAVSPYETNFCASFQNSSRRGNTFSFQAKPAARATTTKIRTIRLRHERTTPLDNLPFA